MNPRQLLRRLAQGHFQNVDFADAVRLVEELWFVYDHTQGSHHFYRHEAKQIVINLQPKRGEAKAYQLRDLIRLIERYDLRMGGRVMGRRDYHINIFYSEEDACYVADLPDFEFCSAFGDTTEEALAELKVAKEGWMETAKKAGIPIPEPRYRPAIYQALVP
jgi:predicted RNase H-like HicB family nuclease/predicted RNA binding protein YcfA (HicA-like mRNA interferase family)